MRNRLTWTRIVVVFAALVLLRPDVPALAAQPSEKVETAVDVLQQIMAIPEKAIPPQLFASAHAIAIVPDLIKVGFVVGGRHGKGVLLVRQGNRWSDPVFVTLAGGSIGWQIGAQSTDVILVFKTERSVEGIMKGKFTLGADAAVAAGPVGRRIEGATDAELKAEIFSYSRSRGLFAGISLEGSAIQIDDDANEDYYSREGVRARDILSGEVGTASPTAARLKGLLAEYSSVPKKD